MMVDEELRGSDTGR